MVVYNDYANSHNRFDDSNHFVCIHPAGTVEGTISKYGYITMYFQNRAIVLGS